MAISRIKKRKRLRYQKLLFTLNVVAVALLFISFIASFVSPAVAWVLALFGIAYPYILVLNLLFVGYWLILKRWEFLLSLSVILLGYSNLQNQFRLNLFNKNKPNGTAAFKLLSFNTRLFDLYQWSGRPETRTRILRLIEKEKPEVLCIQEFYSSKTKPGYNHLQKLERLRKNDFVHLAYTDTSRGNAFWGIGTFSNFPIVRKGSILFNEVTNNLCIFTDLKIGEDTIRVYNAHFQSNRLRREDYEFLGNPSEEKEKMQAITNLLNRLRTGSVKRSGQVDAVANHIAGSPYPVIICGDFNDPPSSYTYNRLRANLKDAFVESGRGFGSTYNGLIPLLRIDYILHDKILRSSGFQTIRQDLSDHFPVMCHLEIIPEAQR